MEQCFYLNNPVKCGSKGNSPTLVQKEHDTWDEYDHRNHEVREMGSGESDVAHLRIGRPIWESNTKTFVTNNTSPWNYQVTIYKYRIKCPNKGCKMINWLELDTNTPCTSCASVLRAVLETPDYTIEVN